MRFKVGDLYHIDFLDHVSGERSLARCHVVGWCVEDHSEHVVLSWWMLQHKDEEHVKHNHEPFSIAKALIKSKKVIKCK
jgi:hypothetical protein